MRVQSRVVAVSAIVVMSSAVVGVASSAATPPPSKWAPYCQATSNVWKLTGLLTYGAPLSQVKTFVAGEKLDLAEILAAEKLAPDAASARAAAAWASVLRLIIGPKSDIVAILSGPYPSSAAHEAALHTAFATLRADETRVSAASDAMTKSAPTCIAYQTVNSEAGVAAIRAFQAALGLAKGGTVNVAKSLEAAAAQYSFKVIPVGARWTISFPKTTYARYEVCLTIPPGTVYRGYVIDGACATG